MVSNSPKSGHNDHYRQPAPEVPMTDKEKSDEFLRIKTQPRIGDCVQCLGFSRIVVFVGVSDVIFVDRSLGGSPRAERCSLTEWSTRFINVSNLPGAEFSEKVTTLTIEERAMVVEEKAELLAHYRGLITEIEESF